MQQIVARRGPLVVITHPGVTLGELDAPRVTVPKNERELDPILLTVPLQMMAYHAALALGHDIDKPRNLAKSVPVEWAASSRAGGRPAPTPPLAGPRPCWSLTSTR